MPYAAVFLTAASQADYEGIRAALGIGLTDVTELPSEVIEASPYLPRVERLTKRVVDDYAAIIVAAGDRLEELKESVRLATASALARFYFAARQGDEVKKATLGPESTDWRDGPKWEELAQRLAAQADALLNDVIQWGGQPYVGHDLVSVDGPTRYYGGRRTPLPESYWYDLLTPDAVKREVS